MGNDETYLLVDVDKIMLLGKSFETLSTPLTVKYTSNLRQELSRILQSSLDKSLRSMRFFFIFTVI